MQMAGRLGKVNFLRLLLTKDAFKIYYTSALTASSETVYYQQVLDLYDEVYV